jgi:hypothetical protein
MTPALGEVIVDTTLNRLRVGDGSTAGGIVLPNVPDIQKQVHTFPTVGGTGNAITLTNGIPVLAYAAGLKQTFKATANNTGATTINVDGLGTKNVYKMNSGALGAIASGDIVSGGIYDVMYDGTQFQIKAIAEGPYSSGAITLLSTQNPSGASTVDFTSNINSTYSKYIVECTNLTGGAHLQALIQQGGSFLTGSAYEYGGQSISQGGTTASVSGSNAAQFDLGNILDSTRPSVCTFVFFRPDLSNTLLAYWESVGQIGSASASFVKGGGGNYNGSPTTGVRFQSSSSTLTGTLKLYGVS